MKKCTFQSLSAQHCNCDVLRRWFNDKDHTITYMKAHIERLEWMEVERTRKKEQEDEEMEIRKKVRREMEEEDCCSRVVGKG